MFNKDKCLSEMQLSINALSNELKNIRTGRVSPDILNSLFVDSYGSKTPLTQLSNVNNLDNMTLNVNVWDASLIKNIEKTILESNLGVTPQSDGNSIILKFPELTAERRKEFAKTSKTFSESAKVAIRNIRQDAMNILKRQSQQGEISDDQLKGVSTKVQKLTDGYISKIIDINNKKEAEILQI